VSGARQHVDPEGVSGRDVGGGVPVSGQTQLSDTGERATARKLEDAIQRLQRGVGGWGGGSPEKKN